MMLEQIDSFFKGSISDYFFLAIVLVNGKEFMKQK
jgi:hypothetical protein